jgi:hypothetical protein
MPGLLKAMVAARRGAASTPWRLAVFALVAASAAWMPLSQVGGLNDFRDAHLLSSYDMAAARTVTDHGQFPLWDPWNCGGLYGLGSPQTRFASPTLLLSVVFGARRAEALMFFAFLLLGLEGAFRFTRARTGSALGALVAAPVFALNGYFALAWSVGWVAYAGFELLPWALIGIHWLARGRLSGGLLTAGAFAVMTGFGGVYTAPLTALAVAAEALRAVMGPHRRVRWRALGLLACGAAFAVAACAFRLWPIAETLASAPRVIGGRPTHDARELLRMAFWTGDGATDGICFLGPAVALALGAVVRRRRVVFPLAVCGLFAWLAAGYAPAWSIFGALRSLPVFEALRYPERFLLPASLFAAELVASGVAGLLLLSRRGVGGRRVSSLLPWPAMALAASGAGWQVGQSSVLAQRAELVAAAPGVTQPFAQARGNRWASDYFVAINRGSLSCGEAYPVAMSERLRGDLGQEEYLADPSAGTVRRAAWSPNRMALDVQLQRPADVLVNQNWHPGWSATGGEAFSQDGLLAVHVPAGATQVVLRFWPRSGIGGALVTAVAFALWIWAWRKRRPWAAAVGAAVPWVLWGMVALAWRQPPTPPVRLNPDGAPILVEDLPGDAQRIGATWAQPIELVGAVLPTAPGPDGLVHFQFYWRLSGPVEKTLGIFVHIEGPDGTRKQTDHEPVAGTYFLHQAPSGVLLRDDFAADTSEYAAGHWVIRVGLWRARGDTSRVAVQNAAGRLVTEDRLELGAFDIVRPTDGGTDAGP